jgi:hypothetical protein
MLPGCRTITNREAITTATPSARTDTFGALPLGYRWRCWWNGRHDFQKRTRPSNYYSPPKNIQYFSMIACLGGSEQSMVACDFAKLAAMSPVMWRQHLLDKNGQLPHCDARRVTSLRATPTSTRFSRGADW